MRKMQSDMIDYVALTLRGELLDPDDVSRRLNVRPSHGFGRGDTTIHPLPTKFGYWRLKIDGPRGELDGYLAELLEAFDEKHSELADLAQIYEVTVTVVADLGDSDEGELSISPVLIDRISAIKAKLRFYWLHGTTDNPIGGVEAVGDDQASSALDRDEIL